MKYQYNNLTICTKKKRFNFEDGTSFEMAKQVITKCMADESLTSVNVNYNEDAWEMQVFSENGKGFIVINDNEEQACYNYSNPKYQNDCTLVEIVGYECPKKNICDDKAVLCEIIFLFLEIGKPLAGVEWECYR